MRRGLLYLYHTLKQMSSKRLLSARQTFSQVGICSADRRVIESACGRHEESLHGSGTLTAARPPSQIATALFPFLLNLWTKGLGGVLQSLTDGTVAAVDAVDQLELARLVLKALRQLLKHGIKDFHADEAAASFFDTLLKQVPVMLELREAVEEDSPVAPVIDSTIVMMMKTICDAQAYSPLSFARFMAPALGLALGALFNIEQESARPKHERFFVLCMILVRTCAVFAVGSRVHLAQPRSPQSLMLLCRSKMCCIAENTDHSMQSAVGASSQETSARVRFSQLLRRRCRAIRPWRTCLRRTFSPSSAPCW